ncbi:hypothetical protein C8A05DRAFT_36512 [Staphylotrichum tortipilum]|uniref:F-box domain-containing protein n=1 Tax=Staphylotrichum tortipilum TaxID=2831512 RepID=A0AAN6RRJ8_9PEZI|nr:hypothetical protein C8A05DRAFT_36512 [Staphylotrichum longicolle]
MPSLVSAAPPAPRDGISPRQPALGLGSLPQDLISMILAHLDDIDHSSLSNAALVCSALYGKARYHQHQVVWIDVGAEHARGRLQQMSDHSLLLAVRVLNVTVPDHIHLHVDHPPPAGNGPASEQLAAWNLLAGLIPSMSGLRQLRWKGTALPEAVVQHLAGNPHISLHLSLYATDRQSHLPGRLARLNLLNQLPATVEPAFPNLSSLHIGLAYCSPELCRPVLQTALKHLLLSTPSLRSLSLNVFYDPDLSLPGRDAGRRQYCGLGFTAGEAPAAALEQLEVVRYPFGLVPTANPDLAQFGDIMANVDGYPNPLPEGNYWAAHFDWARLRRLRLHTPAARLFAAFLVLLPASARLETLAVPGLESCAELANLAHLAHHAATLRSVTVYPLATCADDLATLRSALPRLETLGVVCLREECSWPEEAFAVLASFTEVRELTVWFDVGSPKAVAVPGVTAATAREVAGRIWTLKKEGEAGDVLRKVTVRSASAVPWWELQRYGEGEREGWKRDHEVGFECVWREGEEVEVSCLGLSDAQNGRVRELVAACAVGGKDVMNEMMTEEERGDIRFVMALNGPMTMDEWRAWKKARE